MSIVVEARGLRKEFDGLVAVDSIDPRSAKANASGSSALTVPVQDVALAFLPLTHIVIISRELMNGALAIDTAWSMLWIIPVTVFVWVLSINMMKKRLVV